MALPPRLAQAVLAQLNQQQRRWDTPGDLAKAIEPRTKQTGALDLIDEELVRLANTPDGRLIITMPPQEGKALALDTPIPTPTGWTTMGALTEGDWVFGGDGKPCRVTWVSPVWVGRARDQAPDRRSCAHTRRAHPTTRGIAVRRRPSPQTRRRTSTPAKGGP